MNEMDEMFKMDEMDEMFKIDEMDRFYPFIGLVHLAILTIQNGQNGPKWTKQTVP